MTRARPLTVFQVTATTTEQQVRKTAFARMGRVATVRPDAANSDTIFLGAEGECVFPIYKTDGCVQFRSTDWSQVRIKSASGSQILYVWCGAPLKPGEELRD